MMYVSDKLYDDVVKKMMGRLSSIVKVREILPHLPCLTLSDQEEVEAKRDQAGNYAAVQMLLDNLRRRENWPDEFISALRLCRHMALADEISTAYDTLRGRSNMSVPAPSPTPAPSSLPATSQVTTATVHPAPATVPILSNTPQAEPVLPLCVVAQVDPPPAIPQLSAPEAASGSIPPQESATQAPAPPSVPQSALSTAFIPPSVSDVRPTAEPTGEVLAAEVNVSPSPSGTAEEPEPVAASDIPDVQETNSPPQSSTEPPTPVPSTLPTLPEEVSAHVAVPETLSPMKYPIQETKSPKKVSILPQEPEESSDPTIHQISDNERHGRGVAESSERAHIQRPAVPEPMAGHPSPPGATAEVLEEDECLRKPGVLQSMPGQQENPMVSVLLPPTVAEACSVTSDEIMISESSLSSSETTLVPSPSKPAESNLASDPPSKSVGNPVPEVGQDPELVTCTSMNSSPDTPPESVPDISANPETNSTLTVEPNATPEAATQVCQENGLTDSESISSINQPLEDQYESMCHSLQSETDTHVVYVAEEASMQNFKGQPPGMQMNDFHGSEESSTINDESQTESVTGQCMAENQPILNEQAATADENSTSVNSLGSKVAGSVHLTEPKPEQQEQRGSLPELREEVQTKEVQTKEVQVRHLNNYHLIVAGAVVVLGLVAAWRFKN